MEFIVHSINISTNVIKAVIASLLVVLLLPFAACSLVDSDDTLTVYSGRSKKLIGPILERYAEDTGVSIAVRYGTTPTIATLLLEEGDKTPADVFISQDAGALGALQMSNLLQEIDSDILQKVSSDYKSAENKWVGLSGRARVIVYNTDALSPEMLPDTVFDYTDPSWKGRLAWAPRNASFQSWVTAFRVMHGEDVAEQWLLDMIENDIQTYPNNITIVAAAARGEVDAGFVNHYYLNNFLKEEGEGFKARNHYMSDDIGAMINVAGAGITKSSQNKDQAQKLIDFLLSPAAQMFFVKENSEYALIDGVESNQGGVSSIAELKPANIDLTKIDDLQGTVNLLKKVGALR